MTPQEKAAWANARPAGWLEDAGRSFVTGAENGVTGLATLPHTISEAGAKASDWIVDQEAKAFGKAPLTAQQHAQMRQQSGAMSDLAHLLVQGATNRPLAAANTAAEYIGKAPSPAQQAHMQAVAGLLSGSTGKNALDAAVQSGAGPYHDPQTAAGRTAYTVGEMLPNAALPGGPAARVARVLVPAATSSLAGEAMHGTKYENLARTGGAMAGGLLEGGIEGVGRSPQRVVGNAASRLTDQQIQMADALRGNAADEGINLTIPEAVQQVTNGGTSLGRIQRLVENASPTSPRMAEYFAQRPEQMRGAVMGVADQIAPESINTPPGVLGVQAQGAAQGALDSVRQRINAQTEPLYDALRGQEIPPADYGGLMSNPSYARALEAVRADPELNGAIAHLPDNSLAVVNEVQKQLDTMATAARQTTLNPGGNNFIAALRGEARGAADATARTASDIYGGGQYGAAHDIQSAERAAHLEPLQAGPTGAISQTQDLAAQTGALFPRNPPMGQAAETGAAMQAINGQQAHLADALLRQHVGNTFNQSTRDLVGGQNQYGGALFAKNIAGNAEQANTLTTGLGVADPSGALGNRFDHLLEALQATGRRERPGSMTAFNEGDLNTLKQAPALVKFLGGLGDPLEWTKNLSNWTGGRLYGRNLNILADLLTAPTTTDILQQARSAAVPGANLPVLALPAATAAGANQ